ncbi:2-hydroxyacid dehydrogenase [Rhodalgimonas zhirmunskyi]|uniref:Glyoxylate/hydroxypyruvate reductase A n=1 Tax=Rhodalgimonas zhirmunskyi TaxID=2964767 RepID=A0AAJ1U8F2_9RHOB|nr:glyoxylate/hydroxypyruvate reductase A [Rhodoalgimonas zhirmunskyi]MDQ2093058.1 glyoxylate/hydroxypyruvate reductase A [Rhodoalgimonas zhirmunskyi]
MIGVACCDRIELPGHLGPYFERLAPELDLRRPEEIDRPEEVSYMITFAPAPDAFVPYPNLRAVYSIGAGTDAILDCPSLPEGLPVYRVEDPDQAIQMAGFAAFHVLWHHRNMGQYLENRKTGHWARSITGLSPQARRIGVMGFGHMGRAVARGLVALGYPVAGYSRRMPTPVEPGVTHYTEDDLDAFLAQSDILINVLPLTPTTQGLIDEEMLAKLPEGAALIHLGRGGQVDEAAMTAALDRGQLSGASLDVFETEPLPPGHPLWTHPKVFVTPHVACIPEPQAVVLSIREMLLQHLAA